MLEQKAVVIIRMVATIVSLDAWIAGYGTGKFHFLVERVKAFGSEQYG
jgi:hypothetical protein